MSLLAASCEGKEPPGATMTPSTGLARASASAQENPIFPVTSSSTGALASSAGPPSSAVSSPAVSAASSAAVIDGKNETKPPHTSEFLESQGRALLDAIVFDDVSKANDFFFPREPFTPLKDVKEPDRYWKHLYRAYEQDIHKLHRRHRDWSGVAFESIEPGTPPAWVPPGDEANKIGYHRSWGTKLRYRLEGKLYTVKIHTVISWQGRWYITHLLPWKK
ncbi:MAG TPA: hypothetical protein PLJ27_25550 [Polyangiaceae bacterium]|nr:hypothetical protein [Polyangiaceae bacterium]HNZ24868.1 hypothetical protein [Polyangiaceae bacterium]HOD24600.1 hypothetical protein [Polyangiaceae bacterium]HOE50211.1 hypothetical protein [Polyangiaceae bacterium]HOH02974.1 hypothetical protein [Polyangiaceae bacterium]